MQCIEILTNVDNSCLGICVHLISLVYLFHVHLLGQLLRVFHLFHVNSDAVVLILWSP